MLAAQQAQVWKPWTWVIWLAIGASPVPGLLEVGLGVLAVGRRPASQALDASDIMRHMSGLVTEVHKATGLPVDSLGVSLWAVYAPRRTFPDWVRRRERSRYLWRIERHRTSDLNPTDEAWPVGRGVIGRCVENNGKQSRDYRKLQADWPLSGPPPGRDAWKGIKRKGQHDGFGREDFLRMIHRYEQVLAFPITDSRGRPVGCVSIDVTSEPSDPPHGDVDCDTTRAFAHAFVDALRRTVEHLAVRA